MKHRFATPFFVLISLFVATASFASNQWLHVKIEGTGDDRVTVNLPLSLMEAAVQMIPEEMTTDINNDIEVAIDDVNMDWQDLRAFWESVKNSPEATFATVETKDEKVAVKKEGKYLLVKTTEFSDRGTEVNVKLPMSVVDGLFSGPEGTLNFAAAIQALADHGEGHLVSIRDGDETVQVWIDDQNEAD